MANKITKIIVIATTKALHNIPPFLFSFAPPAISMRYMELGECNDKSFSLSSAKLGEKQKRDRREAEEKYERNMRETGGEI